ncbi:DUF3488 and transglutaminase-like domain-containing protein [Alcanivorax sp. S6407]|uniref:transglutaminase family protein n=1 Tax=Alcanivorax sp. S6407 TaxID=2926424 RepID=UPI001FF48DED|nr:DUF3488 and transglutaminase-like domain-containing protein [Alcanivorax sp. S6407]MCK0152322.1 DUF3488 and transglutaminase-like domain-containing protein [Alcanivorax sp. S6407]
MRVYQVPTHTRLWLVITIIACSLPQLVRGPAWQAGLLGLVLLIRALGDRQRMRMPGRWLRGLMMVSVVALTWFSFGRIYGPEAGVALLVSLFSLKYLEVVRQRDAYVVIVLGYFVCATALLFDRGPGLFAYVLLCMMLLTTCLVGINHSDTGARSWGHLRRGAVMSLQAIPVMLVLFVLVPRVAPLWNMRIDSGQARTGMSDSMAPGEISELSRSSELAFRVSFDGPAPPGAERYWRGLTLSHFDGRTWQQAMPRGMDRKDYLYQAGDKEPDWYRALMTAERGEGYRYQVIMEPTQRQWLFAMKVPVLEQGDAGLARDMRLVANDPVADSIGYTVTSYPDLVRAVPLSEEERSLMLSLPDRDVGRRARGLAQQWRLDADNPGQVVNQALRYFRQQPFYYTLRPPPLPVDPIDEFLFVSRRGFCEHYASSFTFMMRAAGIPARVVVGYQGGEPNALGSHLLIRQYDAHAWSEVWLDGQGWVRVDPTAAVAPDRIEDGLRAALSGSEYDLESLAALQSFANSGLMGRLRQWGDYVDFQWQNWVLGYNSQSQMQLLRQMLGSASPLRIALALLAGITLLLGLYMLVLLRQDRGYRQNPMEREFWRLHQRVSRLQGQPLDAGVTPGQLAERISERWPRASQAASQWALQYQQALYNPSVTTDRVRLRHLRRLRNRLYKLLD